MPAQERQPEVQSTKVANAALTLLACTVAAVGAAFVWPWLARPAPGGRTLNEFSPLHDGAARLFAEYDAGNKITSWTSDNEILLPPGVALAADLRSNQRRAIEKFFCKPGETNLAHDELLRRIETAQIYQTRSRTLDTDGKLTESVALGIRDARGDFLIAVHDASGELDIVLDPPLHRVSSTFEPDHTWESSGVRSGLQGSTDYQYRGRVIGREEIKNTAGEPTNCWKVETRLTFLSQGKTLFERVSESWLGAGVGILKTSQADGAGNLLKRTALVAGPNRVYDSTAALPAPGSSDNANPPKSALSAEWKLSRFAARRVATGAAEHTTAAVWAAGDPAMLMTAVFGGGLTAFQAEGGAELWRFHPGAGIYAEPVVDATRGRIYFGAANKRLYALDTRGLFLWSFAARDNIATRPLMAGKSVIFGSEDRTIYSVDADTGQLNWSAPTAAPVASSPALAGELAVFGADDGQVYAIDIQSGQEKWRFDAGAPVEAPVIFAQGKLFACTHQGDIFAIDDRGVEIWRSKVPRSVRNAPAVHSGRLWLVEDHGQLSAFELATGKRVWRSAATDYVGSPVVVNEHLFVASRNGDVHWLDDQGAVRQTWPAADALSPSDGPGTLRFGPSVGGGAVWLADRRGVVRRLGPPSAGPETLRVAWTHSFANKPFTQHFLNVTPVVHQEQVVVVDDAGDVFRLDPSTGAGQQLGSIAHPGKVAVEPVLTNDTLLTISGRRLFANQVSNWKPLWQLDGNGHSLHPVATAGDLAFWMTQQEAKGSDKAASTNGTLFAVDVRSGTVRWQKPVGGFTAIGGAVARDESVYTSTPPAAFSLAGEVRWHLQTGELGLGGPGLSEDGQVLFVGSVDVSTDRILLSALATADGRVLWKANLGAAPLNPTERPWPAGKVVVVPLWSGEIVALDSGSGAEVWRHKPALPRFGGITVADGLVWLTLQNSRVLALRAETGELVAQFSLDFDLASISTVAPRPVLIGNRIVVPLAAALLGLEKPAGDQTREAETK